MADNNHAGSITGAVADYAFAAGRYAKTLELAIEEQERLIALNGHALKQVMGDEEGFFEKTDMDYDDEAERFEQWKAEQDCRLSYQQFLQMCVDSDTDPRDVMAPPSEPGEF